MLHNLESVYAEYERLRAEWTADPNRQKHLDDLAILVAANQIVVAVNHLVTELQNRRGAGLLKAGE